VSRHVRKLMIGLVLSLVGGEANAVFYGNDVHLWCQGNRSMALAYAAALTDQAARILHTLDVTLRSPQPPVVPPSSGGREGTLWTHILPDSRVWCAD
jgi:hypothetical protein